MKTERTGRPTPEEIEAMIRRKNEVSAMEKCYAASAVKVFDALRAENARLKGEVGFAKMRARSNADKTWKTFEPMEFVKIDDAWYCTDEIVDTCFAHDTAALTPPKETNRDA